MHSKKPSLQTGELELKPRPLPCYSSSIRLPAFALFICHTLAGAPGAILTLLNSTVAPPPRSGINRDGLV